MRFQPLRVGFLAWLAIAAAVAQDQTGRVEGVVVDAVSHQPVKKATVSINFMGGAGRGRIQNGGPQTAITDSTGAFSFSDLPAGKYQINVMQQNYPETPMGGVHKTVEVSAGDTAANVTVELMPGAAISGHIVDEDGDPLNGCLLQPHPAKNFNQGVPMMRVPEIHDDGSYRMFGIPAGKYIISAQCSAPVFQPRPLSEGPDPPPSSAYPVQYYSATSDIKSAEVVELSAGAEKSGVDFQMRPVPVTHIHGTFANGSADWRGHGDLQIQLVPMDQSVQRTFAFAGGVAEINGDGTFDIRQVFPGSYQIVASSQDLSAGPQSEAISAVGGVVRVDVANKPLDVSLPLYHAVDISGRVEFERNNNTTSPITPAQVNLQLEPKNQFSSGPEVFISQRGRELHHQIGTPGRVANPSDGAEWIHEIRTAGRRRCHRSPVQSGFRRSRTFADCRQHQYGAHPGNGPGRGNGFRCRRRRGAGARVEDGASGFERSIQDGGLAARKISRRGRGKRGSHARGGTGDLTR